MSIGFAIAAIGALAGGGYWAWNRLPANGDSAENRQAYSDFLTMKRLRDQHPECKDECNKIIECIWGLDQ